MKILIHKIEKETEKAYQISCQVSWNANYYEKKMWMPKSVIEEIKPTACGNGLFITVKEWFIRKTEEEKAFHGYPMRFDTI